MQCGVASHIFALDTRWMSVVSFTFRPPCTQESAPGTRWTGTWVVPRVGLDPFGKRNVSWPWRTA